VTNAGSAVRGTLAELRECGAVPAVIASLVTLGEAISQFAAEEGIGEVSLSRLANQIWLPAECPLCAAGVPLERVQV
jgi:orotate phosphoribosyltransferase